MYHLTGSRRVSHQHNRQFFPLSMTPPPLSWGQQGQQHPPRRHQVCTMIRALREFFADFSATSGFQSHVIFTRFFADFSSQGFPQNNRNKPFGNVPFNSQVNSLIANYWRRKMLNFNHNSFISTFSHNKWCSRRCGPRTTPSPPKLFHKVKFLVAESLGIVKIFFWKSKLFNFIFSNILHWGVSMDWNPVVDLTW